MKKLSVVFLFCITLSIFVAGSAWAAQICVNNAAGLQAALSSAQGNGEDNLIMVVQGRYKGNFIYESSFGKSIRLQGGYTAGCASLILDPKKTVLDGNHAGTVLYLEDDNGGDISIEEFTIQNGKYSGAGGGVYAESFSDSGSGGTINITWNLFTGNTAEAGGGVYANSHSASNTGGMINIVGNTFRGNHADGEGGGIRAYSGSTSGAAGVITLTWNNLTGNTADAGGGIWAVSSGAAGAGHIEIYNNTITGNHAYTQGGGVYVYSNISSSTGGTIHFMENTITGNHAETQGGGVYAESYSDSGAGSAIIFEGNKIAKNNASMQGGGVYTDSFTASGTGSAIELWENTITGNIASDTGGGIFVYSETSSGMASGINISKNIVSENTAHGQGGGAGIYVNSDNGAITLTGNTVTNNHSYNDAGGVYCNLTNTGNTGVVTLSANIITKNVANGNYGGVCATLTSSSGATGPVTFINNIIAANTSSNEVGGVSVYSSSSRSGSGALTLTNNTITKNSARNGTGGLEVTMSNNTFNCYNNIIWGNAGLAPADLDLYGVGTAYGYNNDYHEMSGSWNGALTGNVDFDPLFDAGGHYRLTPLSPCIDTGNNSAPSLSSSDMDGNARIFNGQVDIGANEYNGSLIAKEPADGISFGGDTFFNKYQPTFEWIAVEPFANFTILFSTSSTDFSTNDIFITKGSVPRTKNNWTPSVAIWKKIMNSSYDDGSIRNIYWKVVGTKADKSTGETPVRHFSIDSGSPPQIISPANGATISAEEFPTFVFDTNSNIQFQIEISSLFNFTDPNKIITSDFTAKNPYATIMLSATLSSSKWNQVKSLIGIGGTGYVRIRAWDEINRETDSDTQSFTIQ